MKQRLTVFLFALGLLACRGDISDKPPLHPNPNMDDQPRYNPQAQSRLFDDGRTMRPPVPGTVSTGAARLDSLFHLGKTSDGRLVERNPLPTMSDLLTRGRERFDIYCGVCHDRAATGQGIMITKYQGMVRPPSFHEDRLRNSPDGHFFDVIGNGIRTMPTYRHQIVESDRWAIVAYIRALQRSQLTLADDVEPERRPLLEIRPLPSAP